MYCTCNHVWEFLCACVQLCEVYVTGEKSFLFLSRRIFKISFECKEDWENEIMQSEEEFTRLNLQDHHWKERSNGECELDNSGLYSSKPERLVGNEYVGRPSTTYLALEIPMQKIHFVDNYKSLRRCQRAISKVC